MRILSFSSFVCVAIYIINYTGYMLRAADVPVPTGRPLRNILDEKWTRGRFFLGAATSITASPENLVILDREFSYVTTANAFKQKTIHPEPGQWNWKKADAWIQHCAENKQIMRLHSPVSPQCSRWAKDDKRTAEELRQNLVEYVTAICKRYTHHPHVRWMDVVNETVLRNGKWNHAKPGIDKWECPWTKIGIDTSDPLAPPRYIPLAFSLATKLTSPHTQLIINQNGGMEPPMWEKIKALVANLRRRNLRVDGIGWQAHIDTGWEKQPQNLARLRRLIDWVHAHGLAFHVTEMNAWMKKPADTLTDQANTVKAILKVLLEKRKNGVVTLNFWDISDRDAWKSQNHWEGCLFDRRFNPKPAYYAVQALLEAACRE